MRTKTTTDDALMLTVRELRSLLTGMRKVIGRRSPNAILRHLLFRFGPKVVVTGSDGKVHAHYLAGSNPAAQGELLVPIESLADLARELPPSEQVRFELKRFKLLVTAGRYRRKIRSAGDPVEFPLGSHRGAFKPLSDDLRDAIVRALACASSDASRHVLNSVFLEPGDKGLEVVATDGRVLHHAGPYDHPLKKAIIVPASPVLRWKGLDEPWNMRLSGRPGEEPWVSIRSGRWTVTAQAIDGNYPAWRQVVPRYRGTKIALPKSLADARRLLRLLPGDTIGIRAEKDGVSLLAREEGSSNWTFHPLDASTAAGPPAQVFLNRAYLLRAFEFGMSQLRIGDAHDPMTFTGSGKLVVMPMRAVNPPPLKS